MRRVILIITLIFSFAAFSTNLPANSHPNLLNGYFLNSLEFLGEHFFLFLVAFVIVSFLIFRSLSFERQHPKKNHLAIILTQSLFVFITGIFLSFLLLIILAVIELNFLAYVIDLNPSFLGIQYNINDITNSLTKFSLAPKVTASDNDHYKELLAIAQATTGTDSFYGKFILSAIPPFVVLPTGKIGSTMLIDKTLIISEINKTELEKITPIVTYLFIKSYFPDRQIKHFPKVSIMSEGEYAKFRNDDYAKKFKALSLQLDNAKLSIASTAALIQNDNAGLADNQALIKSTYSQKDRALSKCVAEGAYDRSGVFVRTNSSDYCQNQTKKFDQVVQTANDRVDFFAKELDKNNKLLKAYQAYEDLLSAESKLTNSIKVNIPLELGLFVPEDSLKIVMDIKSPHGIADYFETVTHEYLHYASHLKSGKTLSVALFEEGLTEYFARNIIQDNLNSDSYLGYPVFVRINSQIMQMIPESELADYYFTKDEQGLEKALNRVYGDNFYQNNVVLFETLQYATDNKQLLKYTNALMAKINGQPIRENDLLSAPAN